MWTSVSVFSPTTHLLNTRSLCSSPQDVTVQKRCHRVYFKKKNRRFSLLLRRQWDFFFPQSFIGSMLHTPACQRPHFHKTLLLLFSIFSDVQWVSVKQISIKKKQYRPNLLSNRRGIDTGHLRIPTVLANETAGCWSSIRDKHKHSSCPPISRWSCMALPLRSVLSA